ncbi:uncharacterized protein LOC102154051 isoform X5 [Canis lupus familiaris]|uniref:uncharacterized protein LOC102154051 isoform X5 n=1 Tax=Canis lupus familiaris TaxID=9615 RepID=UPI0018F65545|nr:uncharacterized protein LOC102154051 isoform X5 [Canis lupus familiaris]XP_038436780.1 uncharacterized protein LOC102154051 isoform X3 [Canis lupus familiaris]
MSVIRHGQARTPRAPCTQEGAVQPPGPPTSPVCPLPPGMTETSASADTASPLFRTMVLKVGSPTPPQHHHLRKLQKCKFLSSTPCCSPPLGPPTSALQSARHPPGLRHPGLPTVTLALCLRYLTNAGSWSLAGVLKNPMASAGPAALWENREGHKHLVTPCKRPLRLLALCSARAHQVPQPGPPLGVQQLSASKVGQQVGEQRKAGARDRCTVCRRQNLAFTSDFPVPGVFSGTASVSHLRVPVLDTERERERQRPRQREKQAPCREPDVGLDPGSPGSHPGPKVELNHWATGAARDWFSESGNVN